jgi:RimJ/RimL family protein N-acetyltransferase
MRKNCETVVSGTRSVLVPYRREHVERYHEWMKSPFLLEMTGSEPLSFEEEVEMQLAWRDDDDKCTFILLNRERCESFLVSRGGDKTHSSEWSRALEDDFITNTLDSMVGDVNLFLSDEEVEDDENGEIDDCAASGVPRKQAELDLMVAEESSRGMGIGKEATCLMMLYGAQELGIRKFTVKIKEENVASRHLFEKVSD